MCERERERERERCVCEREREVCVCVREREVCVRERERCVCVCVCERERQGLVVLTRFLLCRQTCYVFKSEQRFSFCLFLPFSQRRRQGDFA